MPSCSKSPLVVACLLSSLMGCSASTGALLELSVLTTEYAPLSSELLRWGNLAIYLVLAPMAWFVCQLFQTGRRWLALARAQSFRILFTPLTCIHVRRARQEKSLRSWRESLLKCGSFVKMLPTQGYYYAVGWNLCHAGNHTENSSSQLALFAYSPIGG